MNIDFLRVAKHSRERFVNEVERLKHHGTVTTELDEFLKTYDRVLNRLLTQDPVMKKTLNFKQEFESGIIFEKTIEVICDENGDIHPSAAALEYERVQKEAIAYYKRKKEERR